MGDRANVCMDHGKGKEVFLYAHWRGEQMPAILQRALARGLRWDDPQYLGRIIFCEMVKGYAGDETGFGISPTLCDNERPILVVDCEAQVVRMHKAATRNSDHMGIEKARWPFKEFVAQAEMSWATLTGEAVDA